MPTTSPDRGYTIPTMPDPADAPAAFLDLASDVEDDLGAVATQVTQLQAGMEVYNGTIASTDPSNGQIGSLTIDAVPYPRSIYFVGFAHVIQVTASDVWDLLLTPSAGPTKAARWSQARWSCELTTRPHLLDANTSMTCTLTATRAAGSGSYTHTGPNRTQLHAVARRAGANV